MKTANDSKRGPFMRGKSDSGDLIACQFISAFSWILLFLLINFFLLHRSNSIPEAEARLTEPALSVPSTDLSQPDPIKMALLQKPRIQEIREEIIEDDYKPNYYFLYRDQIRFVDIVPKKKVMVAKKTVPAPPRVEPEEPPEPEKKPVEIKWLDMALLEEDEPEVIDPVKETPKKKIQRTVKVAMVRNLDMSLQIQRDFPTPLVREKPQKTSQKPHRQVRISAVDVDMEIMEQQEQETTERQVVQVQKTGKPVVKSSAPADYLAVSMEISSASATGSPGVKGEVKGQTKANRGPVLLAKGHAAPQTSFSMSLDIGGKPEGSPGTGTGAVVKQKGKPGGLLNARGMGGVDMDSGILVGNGSGRESGKSIQNVSPSQHNPVRMIQRNAKGSIPLGAPLSFRLAEVGKETQSGSAYLRGSTQLKRYLDTKQLSGDPVTVSLVDENSKRSGPEGLVAISYSDSQVVLQYETGKQQVVTLMNGEPFPKFELRRAAQGSGQVPVGTKLEEITACLTTLQQVME